ncbi:hypothetical protein PQI08_07330 [Psychrobacter pacificensis]|uniref:hypothetical protein n=1 Tax=Psychrobacter pacificensis TaxID=112002 RepID=UPI0030A4C408
MKPLCAVMPALLFCLTTTIGYSGGVPIDTPIGNIYSTNITPSTRYGIGNYTEADLKKPYAKVGRQIIRFILRCLTRPIMA